MLNQDTAKTFLAKSDPEMLYQFFHQSTQLRNCEEDYNTATDDKNRSQLLLQEKIVSIGDLEKVTVRKQGFGSRSALIRSPGSGSVLGRMPIRIQEQGYLPKFTNNPYCSFQNGFFSYVGMFCSKISKQAPMPCELSQGDNINPKLPPPEASSGRLSFFIRPPSFCPGINLITSHARSKATSHIPNGNL